MARELWAERERARLCDLLDEVGPEAATLREGCSAYDLAAHLYVREHALAHAVGVLVSGRSPLRARVRPGRGKPPQFAELVEGIRRGGILPREGRWAENLHLLEFVVRQRQVLSALPGTATVLPAERDGGRASAVFEQLRRHAVRLASGVPAATGLVLRSRDHGAIEVRRGPEILVVHGDPAALALWAHGMGGRAGITLENHGPADLPARVEAALATRAGAGRPGT